MGISRTKHNAVSAAATIQPLPRSTLDAIRQFDTCSIANAIEHFSVRLRNEGFTRPGLQCVTGGSPRILGYAATCSVRSAEPPMSGNAYADRTDWWETIGLLPVPRIAIFQDLDAPTSGASTIGEVHAAVLKALQCEGMVTNGSVRDIPGVSRMEFPMFASPVSISHAYMHVVDFGAPADGLQYPQACSKVLTDDPSLYSQYCRELAAGETVTAPDPSKLDVPVEYFQKVAKAAEDAGVCAECDGAVDDDDKYCAACGSDLSAQRETAKGKSGKKRKDDPGGQRV